MIKTYTEQLEEVQTAISEALTAQSLEINTGNGSGRKITRAALDALHVREKYLRQMAARETRGGIRIQGVVPY